MLWLLCAAIGLLAGTLGGLLGVGGGVVLVPAFTRLLGFSVKQAIGTSMGVILFTAISASWRHWQLGHLRPDIVVVVAALSMAGAWLGASLSSQISERALRIVFALFLIVTAADMLASALRMDGEPPAASQAGVGR
ncbi:MAG: sulfite exporter TauE/SafE family protein [Deltaproteobacteria bacterium]|nr:sulfite exporter TauE/SafE family protein [Deltaproteobacteria bacterium]